MSAMCPVCKNQVNVDASVCPFCGFKLSGSTQRFEPLSFQTGEIAPAPTSAPEAALVVVRGPQRGVSFTLSQKPLLIGRDPSCDIFLNDMTVSREHAVVESDGIGFVIRDKNSFNGVWVNNQNVETHRLVPGDILQIGAFCLAYNEE